MRALALLLLLPVLSMASDGYYWRGQVWHRMPAYQHLPDTWRPRILTRVEHAMAQIACGSLVAKGCAISSIEDPGSTCRIVIAGLGRTPAEIEDIALHERAHCYGWVHDG